MGEYSGYEKWRLGWMVPKTISSSDVNYVLYDLASTMTEPSDSKEGRLFKIDIPSTNQYFLIENRQWTTPFEPRYCVNSGDHGKLRQGILIYQIIFENDDLSQTQIQKIDADGRFQWNILYHGTDNGNIFDDVVDRGIADRVNGYSETEKIYISGYSPQYWITEWHPSNLTPYGGGAYKCTYSGNGLYETGDETGDSLDIYQVGDVLTPWSNPASHQWDNSVIPPHFTATTLGLQVMSFNSDNQSYTLSIKLTNPESLAPSKPQDIHSSFSSSIQTTTTWSPNSEPDLRAYYVYRQFYYFNDDGTEHNISEVNVTTGGILSTTFNDNFGTPPTVPTGKILYLRYKIQSNDNNANYSLKTSGNSLRFLPSSIASGSSLTIDGENTALNNVSIYGALTVSPRASIKFYNNSSLIVYSGSNFNASGLENNMITFDFVAKNSNGIKFQTNATGILKYCNIKNANYGVYCTNGGDPNITHPAPFIQNCNINHNNYGIYYYVSGIPSQIPLNNTISYNTFDGIYIYVSSPQGISGNTISNNGRYGIYCYSGNPGINNNNISNNSIGIYCYNTSGYNGVFPYIHNNTIETQFTGTGVYCNSNSKCNLLSSPSGYGNNNIINNFYSVQLDHTSTLYANNGYNSIYLTEDYNIYANNNSVAYVTNNCWDQSQPRILLQNGSAAYWQPALPPCGGGLLKEVCSSEPLTGENN